MKLIPLTQGKFAKVDDLLFPLLSRWKWSLSGDCRYAMRNLPNLSKDSPHRVRYMHQDILAPNSHMLCDHKDLDTLNNQIANLRIVTSRQNGCNRTGWKNATSVYKGVFWAAHAGKWRAMIMVNRKGVHLGYFINEKDAARAYDAAARIHFGDHGRYNFPTPNERSALR